MAKLRVAGFNVENLFTRPRVLNLKDNDRIAELLKMITEFKALIERKSYAGVEDRIVELYSELFDYIELNVRSRKEGLPREFLTKEKLVAKGSGDFVGFVEFRRDNLSGEQFENSARVIRAVMPDVLGLVEVENRTALQRFDTDVLGNFFDDLIVVDGNDPRGIDIAAATRKGIPILGVRTNVLARDDDGYIFSRDCLEVEVNFGNKPLHILINHFKAKDRFPKKSDAKRKRQATELHRILTKRFDMKKDNVIVLGDFNDEPESAPLEPMMTTPGLLNTWDLVGRPDGDRWTYYFGGSKQFNKIDMLLVSKALASNVADAGIERRGIADLAKITMGKESSFPEVTSWRVSASDHAAVWVDLKS